MKKDGGQGESDNHDWNCPQHDTSTTDWVDDPKSDKGENKIDTCNQQADGRRILETDHGEQGRRVVHKRVEPAQLLRRLQGTPDYKCSTIRSDTKAGQSSPKRCVVDGSTLLDSCVHDFDFPLDLQRGRERVNLG